MKGIVAVSQVVKFARNLFGGVMHAARAESLGYGAYAAMVASRLTSADMGRSLAAARGTAPKHSIKHIDRIAGNGKIDMDASFGAYVRHIVGCRKSLLLSLDWTEYDSDNQSRISVNIITKHGRATPLIWITVSKDNLKNKRYKHECDVLTKLRELLPEDISVIVIADRGFGDVKFYKYISTELTWDYIIRFKDCIFVEDEAGEKRKAKDWRYKNGATREIVNAKVTGKRKSVPSVVLVKQRGMKDAWNIATSIAGKKKRVVRLYGRRFSCEEQFRDEKDDRFGLGSKETRISTPARRDRLLLLHALSTLVLTVLGAAGEALHWDKDLRANTSKVRTHSLFAQGRAYFRWVVRPHQELLDLFWRMLKALPRTAEETGVI